MSHSIGYHSFSKISSSEFSEPSCFSLVTIFLESSEKTLWVFDASSTSTVTISSGYWCKAFTLRCECFPPSEPTGSLSTSVLEADASDFGSMSDIVLSYLRSGLAPLFSFNLSAETGPVIYGVRILLINFLWLRVFSVFKAILDLRGFVYLASASIYSESFTFLTVFLRPKLGPESMTVFLRPF